MLAYHNNQSIKDKYIARMKGHMKADALIQGTGWDGHKGCAVGCTFENYNHARGPIEIGVPETLMQLEDYIFEGLPVEQAKAFPLEFLTAIPVGANLSMVWPRFALWLLASPDHGVLRHCNDDAYPSAETAVDLYRRWIHGDQPSAEEFEAAARVAWTAAWAATARASEASEASEAAAWASEAAAWVAAAWAAEAVEEAEAAAWTVRAARAAEETEDASSWEEDTAFWRAARDELLRLLREAPVAVE